MSDETSQSCEPKDMKVASEFHGEVTINAENIIFGSGNIDQVQNAQPQVAQSLEKSISEMRISSSANSESAKPLSKETLSRLSELSDSHMTKKQYKEALQILKSTLDQQKVVCKILGWLKIVKCQVEMELLGEALKSYDQLKVLIDESTPSKTQPLNFVNSGYTYFVDLVKKFAAIGLLETALSMQKTLFLYIELFCEGKLRLIKLSNLGVLMSIVSIECRKQNKNKQLKPYYNFMDDIWNELKTIENVEDALKCEKIACFLLNYAGVCDNDREKAFALNTEVISSMNATLGNKASNYCVFGHSHNNVGVYYEHLNELDQASVHFQETLSIYWNASDWPDSNMKEYFVSNILKNLDRIENKLKHSK